VRRPADARHPLGPERGLRQRDRRHAVGRDEPLGQRHDAGTLRDAEARELGHGLRHRLGRHSEEEQVRAAELVGSGERPYLQVTRQLDARQIALVLSRRREQLRLLNSARQQRRAQPRPLQQDRHGGAERAGADHGGPAGMLARVADAGTLAQVTW
jgi:hypothetical protein